MVILSFVLLPATVVYMPGRQPAGILLSYTIFFVQIAFFTAFACWLASVPFAITSARSP